MASKRDLKKAIRRSCGALAGECVVMQSYFAEQTDPEQWDALILETAMIQTDTIKAISVPFADKPGKFANGAQYRKNRRAFVRSQIAEMRRLMSDRMQEVAKRMNALVPADK